MKNQVAKNINKAEIDLEHAKSSVDRIDEELPADIQKSIAAIGNKFIVAQEKCLDLLKKKL